MILIDLYFFFTGKKWTINGFYSKYQGINEQRMFKQIRRLLIWNKYSYSWYKFPQINYAKSKFLCSNKVKFDVKMTFCSWIFNKQKICIMQNSNTFFCSWGSTNHTWSYTHQASEKSYFYLSIDYAL